MDTSEMILAKLNSLERRMDSIENKISDAQSRLNAIDEDAINKGVRTRDEITEYLLSTFDFEKCANVMEFLGWTWVGIGSDTPTANDIKKSATDMLERAWNDLDEQPFNKEGWREWMVRTGGLEVWVFEGNEECGNDRLASLKFVLEEESVE